MPSATYDQKTILGRLLMAIVHDELADGKEIVDSSPSL